MTNLRYIFYEEKEIQDIMKKYYQMKRNLIIYHNLAISICLKYVDKIDFFIT